MVAVFLDDNKNNDNGDGVTGTPGPPPSYAPVYINKQQLYTSITLFCTFL